VLLSGACTMFGCQRQLPIVEEEPVHTQKARAAGSAGPRTKGTVEDVLVARKGGGTGSTAGLPKIDI
jgi:hypothetical protein